MINSLFTNAYSLYISRVNMNLITLPWDLFKLTIKLDDEIVADKFLEFISNTVKAYVVTPQNDKKFHNFQRGYDKGYKFL